MNRQRTYSRPCQRLRSYMSQQQKLSRCATENIRLLSINIARRGGARSCCGCDVTGQVSELVECDTRSLCESEKDVTIFALKAAQNKKYTGKYTVHVSIRLPRCYAHLR